MTGITDRVKIHATTILSMRKYLLRNFDVSWCRTDGNWQRQQREVYDKGDGAVVLLYDRTKKTVVLIRQFRLPAFISGHPHMLVEATAGVLDGADPATRIKAEIEEETGYKVAHVEKVFEAFMSPGAFTEKLHFFIAEYGARPGKGGGLADESEDIEVLELPFAEAYAMIASGKIIDAKTIMLLQYAVLNLFAGGV
jgi:nudix-type nucleoside diphosphatase (YffH/AdpP family)